MAFATLISRITGFTRIVLLAAILGAALSSAFSVANQLPNLIAALVLEATFTAIFVPVLARAERDDEDGGEAFVRRLVTLATTLLFAATVLSVAAAPLLVRMMLGSHPQVDQSITTAFAYLLLPQVIFYGLSSVFMAILNTRNIFGPPAWAPVVNNVVAISTLVVYLVVPGEVSLDPVQMGRAKILVLGIGTTLGVVAQAAVLLFALKRERVSLRPLWGIDERLKRFGAMAGAMVLYVLISQGGLVVGNQIASGAAASGPAIYNYTWLVLMLPYGMIGVTILTVVMPRLSRNAAADDIPAVLADMSLATRLTMVVLIPVVAFMTVGGPAMGSALFAYGNFGELDAGYLGAAISLSAFTLIPYAVVLLQLRVFYAREQAWTPILIVILITAVKIVASLAVPHLVRNPELVAGYLGLANGLGFLAGAAAGHVLLRGALGLRGGLRTYPRNLPPGAPTAHGRVPPPGRGSLVSTDVARDVLVTVAASLLAGLVAYVADRLLGLHLLTAHAGGPGSLLRLLLLGVIMLPIIVAVMLGAKVPEAQAALIAVQRRIGWHPVTSGNGVAGSDRSRRSAAVTYPEPGVSASARSAASGSTPPRPPGAMTRPEMPKGMSVTDETAGRPASDATIRRTRPLTDDLTPDVPAPPPPARAPRAPGDAGRETVEFAAPRETADSAGPDDDQQLVPGARIANGRYRLLVFHGGPDRLQFWQALDTALDRQVGLTFVDPEAELSQDEVQDILSRTLRLSRVDMPGIARVLDVARIGHGGLVVSEWIRGGSLKEVADTAPSPLGGARAMQSLAAAAEAAHRAGVALSIDHPSRVRVSIEGDVALAFPATLPGSTPDDDIRGIGAALYALLVDRWPLPETTGEPSGLAPAETDAEGQPKEPKAIDPKIPFQISAAAVRSIQPAGGIRTAASLLNLLQQATVVAEPTVQLTPIEAPEPDAAPTKRIRTAVYAPVEDELDDDARARRRRGLLVGLGVAGVIIVVTLLVLASVLSRIFGDVGGGLNSDELGLNPQTSTSTTAQGAGGPIKPVKATVFSPGGGADAPDSAGLAIDGDTTTFWPTDTYSDPAPFPGFKSGVGLLLDLPKPAVITAVNVNLSSTGTKIQIRSASSSNPSALADTAELTQPTSVKPGNNRIPVDKAAPTSHVLVWISTLGTTDGESRSDIYEITVDGTT